MMQNFSKIFPIFSFSSIHETEPLPVSLITTDVENLLWNFIDVSIGGPLRIFVSVLTKKKVHLRHSLLYLHSMRYIIQMCEKISGEKVTSGSEFIKAITLLRKEWFFLPVNEREKNIIDLLKEAIYISFETNEQINHHLKDTYVDNYVERIWYRHPKLGAYFCPNWDRNQALEKQFRLYRSGASIAILPSMFSIPIISYASGKGKFGTYIRKYLHLKSCFRKPLISFQSLKDRYRLLERYLMMPEHIIYRSMTLYSLYGYQLQRKLLNMILSTMDTGMSFFEYLLKNPYSAGTLKHLISMKRH